MDDMERRNAVQYMLMVYLRKRWAKRPEERGTSECWSKRCAYPQQGLESPPGLAASNAAFLERL
jgi:hypothetical protein